MGKIEHLLDEIQRLDQETTKGPWAVGGKSVDGFTFFGEKYCDCCPPGEGSYGELIGEAPENDAEFIALARTALPQLANVLRAVLNECDEMDAVYEPAGDSIRQAITDAMEGANSA